MDFYSARHSYVEKCCFINFHKKINLKYLHLKRYCLFACFFMDGQF